MSTELELVNHLLSTVGENTTPTLQTQHPSVIQAKRALGTYNKSFQTKGWWFNREWGVRLVPNSTGKIKLPTNYLSFYPSAPGHAYAGNVDKNRYSKRDGYIYDTRRHTDVIGHALSLDVLVLLPIEDLPEVAATYLMHLAAAEYYLDDDGDIAKKDRLDERRDDALAALRSEELKHTKPNALQSPFGAQLRYRIGQFNSPSNPMFPGGRY